MAFSKHYKDQHPGLKPKVSVRILKKTKGSFQRKLTEALYIQELAISESSRGLGLVTCFGGTKINNMPNMACRKFS